MTEQTERIVVVTGGSRGIGRAICLSFAVPNTSIYFNYFSPVDPDAEAAAAAKPKSLLPMHKVLQKVKVLTLQTKMRLLFFLKRSSIKPDELTFW